MLQCNRSPGLDANEIIRLTSAIGQKATVEVAIQFQYRRFRRGSLNDRYSARKLTP